MPLTKNQAVVAYSDKRFKVIVAGRRWGKSASCLRAIAEVARHPNKKVMYVAPTYQMCRTIMWLPLKNKLRDLNWIKKINESRLEILLTNNSLIMLKSADNPDSLRGIGLDLAILDECQDLKSDVWTDVLRPTLSDRQGSALFTGTPKGMDNHLKDLFDMAATHKNWGAWQFTTAEGENVTEEEIEDAKRTLDKKTFSQEYLASFETSTNIVYYAFKPKNNVKKYKENKQELKSIYVLTDFGVSPMATLIAVPTDTGLWVIDEICLYSSNTDEMVQEVRNRYPHQHITCFPDPAGIQRRSSSGGRTDISILQNAGWDVRYKRRAPFVRDRVNATNSLLLNSNDVCRLFIDPKCRELIKSLTRFSYKENTLIPNKGGKNDYSHFPDALGYGVDYMFPVSREIEPDYTRSWGVF